MERLYEMSKPGANPLASHRDNKYLVAQYYHLTLLCNNGSALLGCSCLGYIYRLVICVGLGRGGRLTAGKRIRKLTVAMRSTNPKDDGD